LLPVQSLSATSSSKRERQVNAMVKLIWMIRPEIWAAASDLAIVNYRLVGAEPVVWKVVPKMPKMAVVDDTWAARIASDATEAIRRYLLQDEGAQRRPVGR
jgi:hypothetical protein